jgi:hypothetical protein
MLTLQVVDHNLNLKTEKSSLDFDIGSKDHLDKSSDYSASVKNLWKNSGKNYAFIGQYGVGDAEVEVKKVNGATYQEVFYQNFRFVLYLNDNLVLEFLEKIDSPDFLVINAEELSPDQVNAIISSVSPSNLVILAGFEKLKLLTNSLSQEILKTKEIKIKNKSSSETLQIYGIEV